MTFMKISGNSLRPGHIIIHQGRMWAVTKAQHTQPGKGGAYMCVGLRDIQSNTKKDERFRAAEDVERAFIEETEHEFLYQEGETYVLMDTESYTQINVAPSLFNVPAYFLQPQAKVTVGFHEGVPVFVMLPAQVTLEVEDADPVVKGQTAASSFKPARLSNGIKVMVPPYIEVGAKVIINTEDESYVERVQV